MTCVSIPFLGKPLCLNFTWPDIPWKWPSVPVSWPSIAWPSLAVVGFALFVVWLLAGWGFLSFQILKNPTTKIRAWFESKLEAWREAKL